jgi:beta-lactamase class A
MGVSMSTLLALLCLNLAAPVPTEACLHTKPDAELEKSLAPLVKAHEGKVGVAVKHLITGETWSYHGDQVCSTASLIKASVLVELYLQADEGKLALTDRVVLKDTDKVPGSGILTEHFSDGTNISLRDCARLMTAISDNTATNLILDRVGIAAVNRRMASMGLPETRVNAKVYRGSVSSVDKDRTKLYGLGSTTANEMIALFEKLHNGEHGIRPPLKLAMMEHLKKNDDKDKFRRHLPRAIIAYKDGSVSTARTAAGILYTPTGPVALCVLTDENKDRRWTKDNAGDLLCANIAKAVYDRFKGDSR